MSLVRILRTPLFFALGFCTMYFVGWRGVIVACATALLAGVYWMAERHEVQQ